MKLLYSTAILAFSFFSINAQEKYSFVTDKVFTNVNDLVGYQFNPSQIELSTGDTNEFSAGDYSFGVTRGNLYISGEDVQGVYNINNMIPEDFGFRILTMDPSNPMAQGHLKVILDNEEYVNALVFKKDRHSDEIIFYLPELTKSEIEQEKEHFTDQGELIIEETDSIWGKTYTPFFRTHLANNRQERLWVEDSTLFEFKEEIGVKRTTKKVKDTEELERLEALTPAELAQENSKLLKKMGFEVKQQNTIRFKTTILLEDGTENKIDEEFEVKGLEELEDEAAKMNEEKYLLQMETKEGPVLVYLLGNRSISGIEFQGMHFDVRR